MCVNFVLRHSECSSWFIRCFICAAFFAACSSSLAIDRTQPERDGEVVATMPIDKTSISPKDIMGAWVHSHEEDPTDGSLREVYRPSDWNFGPSRGRRGYDLQEGNLALVQGIGPADGPTKTKARWRLEPGNVLIILNPSGAIRRLHIEDVAPDRLVLRELLDSN